MTATIIDGTTVALASRARTASRAAAFQARHGIAPGLATVLVGDDPASEVYVRNKRRAATEAGIPPGKDVDGLTTLSQGLLARGVPGLRPCTPSGVIELLDAAGVGMAGDVAFDEVSAVAGHLTPVPGGVGPMTIAALLANTVSAAEAGTASTDQRFAHYVL